MGVGVAGGEWVVGHFAVVSPKQPGWAEPLAKRPARTGAGTGRTPLAEQAVETRAIWLALVSKLFKISEKIHFTHLHFQEIVDIIKHISSSGLCLNAR